MKGNRRPKYRGEGGELNELSMLDLLVEFLKWVDEGKCKIRDQSGRLVSIVPNSAQVKVTKAMLKQAKAGKPIRVIVLKDRKPGISTWIQAMGYFLSWKVPHWYSQTMAHTKEDAVAIFDIAKRVHMNNDAIDEGKRQLFFAGHGGMKFPEWDSSYAVRTGGGKYVSSGSTLSLLHLSELGKWLGTETAVKDVLVSLMNAVPDDPRSIVVIESTANASDNSGQFEARWNSAWRQESGNGYEAVFIGWNEDDRKFVDTGMEEGTLELIDEDERVLKEKYELKDGQILWRRNTIATKFVGDVTYFRQEFPITPEEAFMKQEGLIFPYLTRQRHHWEATSEELSSSGYDFYRSVDFGGNHPFVCVGIAHKPLRESAFTVDCDACPDVWEELRKYKRDVNGKPSPLNNHAIDAIRIAIQHWRMQGHVHIYRVIYERDTAKRGETLVDLAKKIQIRWKEDEHLVQGTICDRTRPDSISLLCQLGISSFGSVPPQTKERGEIEDGLAAMASLMMASHEIDPAPKPIHIARKMMNMEDSEDAIGSPIVSSDTLIAMASMRLEDQEKGTNWMTMLGGMFR